MLLRGQRQARARPGGGGSRREDRQGQAYRQLKHGSAIETMQNPRYPSEPFLRVIMVSLETMMIVDSLPMLDVKLEG